MTANQSLMIPLMATAFLSFAVSRLICRRPLYSALARRFLQVQEKIEPPPTRKPAAT
jgi:H+/Cl- antiporter ClcA